MPRAPLIEVVQSDTMSEEGSTATHHQTPNKTRDKAAAAAAAKLLDSAKKSKSKKQKAAARTKLSLQKHVGPAGGRSVAEKLHLSYGEGSGLNDTVEFKESVPMRVAAKAPKPTRKRKKEQQPKQALSAKFLKVDDTLEACSNAGDDLAHQSPAADTDTNSGFSGKGNHVTWQSAVADTGTNSGSRGKGNIGTEKTASDLPVATCTNKGSRGKGSISRGKTTSEVQETTSTISGSRGKGNIGRGKTTGEVPVATSTNKGSKGKGNPVETGQSTSESVRATTSCEDEETSANQVDAASSSQHSCRICGEVLRHGGLVRHMQMCLKERFGREEGAGSDKATPAAVAPPGQDEALPREYFFCQLCQKDLSHLNSQRRSLHLNQCMDMEEKQRKEGKERERALESAKTHVLDCPMCGLALRTVLSRKNHLKKCASNLGVEPDQLLSAVKRQEEEHRAALEAGILPHTYRPGRGGRQNPVSSRRGLASLPKSKLDEDTQLALAMSSSLRADSDPGEAQPRSSRGTATAGRRGRKNKQEEHHLLLELTEEQASGRIETRVSNLITMQEGDDEESMAPLPAVCSGALGATATAGRMYWSGGEETAAQGKMFWGLASLEEGDGTAPDEAEGVDLKFYVRALMPPVEVSGVVAGSKIRRMSEIPGRMGTQVAPSPVDPEEGNFGRCDEDTPPPSTQTAALLADMAAEADGMDLSLLLSRSPSPAPGGQRDLTQDLLSDFMSLVNQQDLSDVTIHTAGDTTLHAHRLILSVRCPALLKLSEAGGGRVDLPDCSPESVLDVLKFVYAGATAVDQRHTVDTRLLAQRLGLTALADICRRQQPPPLSPLLADSQREDADGGGGLMRHSPTHLMSNTDPADYTAIRTDHQKKSHKASRRTDNEHFRIEQGSCQARRENFCTVNTQSESSLSENESGHTENERHRTDIENGSCQARNENFCTVHTESESCLSGNESCHTENETCHTEKDSCLTENESCRIENEKGHTENESFCIGNESYQAAEDKEKGKLVTERMSIENESCGTEKDSCRSENVSCHTAMIASMPEEKLSGDFLTQKRDCTRGSMTDTMKESSQKELKDRDISVADRLDTLFSAEFQKDLSNRIQNACSMLQQEDGAGSYLPCAGSSLPPAAAAVSVGKPPLIKNTLHESFSDDDDICLLALPPLMEGGSSPVMNDVKAASVSTRDVKDGQRRCRPVLDGVIAESVSTKDKQEGCRSALEGVNAAPVLSRHSKGGQEARSPLEGKARTPFPLQSAAGPMESIEISDDELFSEEEMEVSVVLATPPPPPSSFHRAAASQRHDRTERVAHYDSFPELGPSSVVTQPGRSGPNGSENRSHDHRGAASVARYDSFPQLSQSYVVLPAVGQPSSQKDVSAPFSSPSVGVGRFQTSTPQVCADDGPQAKRPGAEKKGQDCHRGWEKREVVTQRVGAESQATEVEPAVCSESCTGPNLSVPQTPGMEWSPGVPQTPDMGRTPGLSVGQTPGLSMGQTPRLSMGQTPGLSMGQTPGLSKEQTPGLSMGQTSGFSMGQTPGLSKEQTPGLSMGQTPGLSMGQTPRLSMGHNPGLSVGRTSGLSMGQTPGLSMGHNPGLSMGRTSGLSMGQTPGVSVVEQDSLYMTPVEERCRIRRTFQLQTPALDPWHSDRALSRSQACSVGGKVGLRKRSMGEDRTNADCGVVGEDWIDVDSDIEIVDTSLLDAPSPTFAGSSQSQSNNKSTDRTSAQHSSPGHVASGRSTGRERNLEEGREGNTGPSPLPTSPAHSSKPPQDSPKDRSLGVEGREGNTGPIPLATSPARSSKPPQDSHKNRSLGVEWGERNSNSDPADLGTPNITTTRLSQQSHEPAPVPFCTSPVALSQRSRNNTGPIPLHTSPAYRSKRSQDDDGDRIRSRVGEGRERNSNSGPAPLSTPPAGYSQRSRDRDMDMSPVGERRERNSHGGPVRLGTPPAGYSQCSQSLVGEGKERNSHAVPAPQRTSPAHFSQRSADSDKDLVRAMEMVAATSSPPADVWEGFDDLDDYNPDVELLGHGLNPEPGPSVGQFPEYDAFVKNVPESSASPGQKGTSGKGRSVLGCTTPTPAPPGFEAADGTPAAPAHRTGKSSKESHKARSERLTTSLEESREKFPEKPSKSHEGSCKKGPERPARPIKDSRKKGPERPAKESHKNGPEKPAKSLPESGGKKRPERPSMPGSSCVETGDSPIRPPPMLQDLAGGNATPVRFRPPQLPAPPQRGLDDQDDRDTPRSRAEGRQSPGGFVQDDCVFDADGANSSFMWSEENAPEEEWVEGGGGGGGGGCRGTSGDEGVLVLGREETVQVVYSQMQPKRTPSFQRERRRRMGGKSVWVPPSPFTPMPAFDAMATPDLKEQVQRFGLKPVGKKRMRLVLKDIYHHTHQYETDSDCEVDDTAGPDVASSPPETSADRLAASQHAPGAPKHPQPPKSRQPKKAKPARPAQPKKKTDNKRDKTAVVGSEGEGDGPTRAVPRPTHVDGGLAGKRKPKTKKGLAAGATDPQKTKKGVGVAVTLLQSNSSGDFPAHPSQPSPRKHQQGGQAGKSRADTLSPVKTTAGDYSSSPEKGSVSSSQCSESSEHPDVSVLELAGEDSDEDITPSQLQSAQDLPQKLMQFFQTEPELHHKVLTYEPIDMVVLKDGLKTAGIRCSQEKLRSFLNEKCITFTTKNMLPQRRLKNRCKKPRSRKTTSSQK